MLEEGSCVLYDSCVHVFLNKTPVLFSFPLDFHSTSLPGQISSSSSSSLAKLAFLQHEGGLSHPNPW